MKTCTKCGELKTIHEFYLDRAKKDNASSRCKECTKESVSAYYQTEKGKEVNKRAVAKYLKTEKGKKQRKKNKKKYQKTQGYLVKDKARKKLAYAVKSGKIHRPDHCTKCGNKCTPEGHHEKYDEVNYLNVTWLCRRCHMALHGIIVGKDGRSING